MEDPGLAAAGGADGATEPKQESMQIGAIAKDESAAEGQNFRVAVRVRPLNEREKSSSAQSAWKIKKNVISSTESRGTSLHFGSYASTIVRHLTRPHTRS